MKPEVQFVICPNCKTRCWNGDKNCKHCDDDLSTLDGHVEYSYKVGKSKFSPFFIKFAIFSIILTTVSFLLGLGLVEVIPGCTWDEGQGSHGCGINTLLDILIVVGFLGAVFSVFVVLPISLILAFFAELFFKTKK
jgi:ABC-type phosphate transport system permease subunit